MKIKEMAEKYGVSKFSIYQSRKLDGFLWRWIQSDLEVSNLSKSKKSKFDNIEVSNSDIMNEFGISRQGADSLRNDNSYAFKLYVNLIKLKKLD